jgi:hypothetical protein
MRHSGPIPSSDRASTSATRRLARILMIWTGVLTILMVAGMRSLPPTLVWLILPYLALVAWHLLARSEWRPAKPLPTPVDSGSVPLGSLHTQVVGCLPPEVVDERVETSDSHEPCPARTDASEGPQVNPSKVRARRRGKPLSPPEPVPASWVQVGPGRYVRGEEPDPAPAAPNDASVEEMTVAVTSGEGSSHVAVSEEGICDQGAGDSPDDPGVSEGIDDAQDRGAIDLMLDRSGQPLQ